MNFNLIPTHRLLLREMNLEVYQYVFSTYTDEQLKEFFGLSNDAELEQKRSMYRNGLTMFNKSFLYFQLLDKQTENFMGWCGFHTWYIQHHRAEIGYGLSEESARGKGYMKEVFPFVLRAGFENMNLHRVEALIGPGNTPSLKLVQRFGFTKEGTLREHYYKDGIAEDSVVFSLLKNEFETLK
jgi:[ribosomal protein S5]-alanine N-acetyltransferase